MNTSGQFVGVAEMVGPVDFDKMVETGSKTSGPVANGKLLRMFETTF